MMRHLDRKRDCHHRHDPCDNGVVAVADNGKWNDGDDDYDYDYDDIIVFVVGCTGESGWRGQARHRGAYTRAARA